MTEDVFISAPVALERDVCAGSLVRSCLDGQALVVWRGNSDRIHVWHDNCPHRSVRLSAGRNLGDCLEAIYHGWRFAEDATVVSVPAEGGKSRLKISANVLASETIGGFVWASTGDKIEPDRNLVGTPIRPVFVTCPHARLRSVLPRIDDTYLKISPWDETASVVYGSTHSTELSMLKEINAKLVKVQRQAERGDI